MTRRELLWSSLGLSLPSIAAAQAPDAGVSYREYARCLPDYLRRLAEEAYQRRNAEIAKLTSPAAVRERQRWARDTFWQLAGGRPERTPLNAKVVSSFERNGYRVENLHYETRPGFIVPANLYIPTSGKPPYPGVLFQMGHSLNGKAAGVYQKCCQGLVQLGYVVLGFDPMGQGERAYYPRENGYLTRLSSADDEHTYPGKQMLLTGDSSTRLQVWDAVRSLDYLAAHPLVDPKRLASTGNSGGGTLTMLLAAVDDRLAAAALSCPNTENLACANFNPPGSTDDAEQNFIDGGPAGFGRWDCLYPFAPKPLLIMVSARDFFGTYSPNYISNGREEYQKLRSAYRTLDAEDRIRWTESPLPHGLNHNMRMQIYNWMGRWLKGDTEPIAEEPPVNPETDKPLWVTRTGNVVIALGSETPFTLNRRRAAEIRTPDAVPDLRKLLRAEAPPSGIRATVMGRTSSTRVDVEVIEVNSTERVWVPAYLFLPRDQDRTKPVLLALEPSGRVLRWREDELHQTVASTGMVVCLPDRRGVGDLRPEFPRGSPQHGRYHQSEEHYAWASVMLGRPMLGQRVTDILAMAAALRNHEAARGRRLVIAARASSTVPALFAAAIDPQISALYLSGGLTSYRSLVETDDYKHTFANFLPRVLEHTDLPQIAASMNPRPIYLAGAVDAAGRTLATDVVLRIYGSGGNVKVSQNAAWDLG